MEGDVVFDEYEPMYARFLSADADEDPASLQWLRRDVVTNILHMLTSTQLSVSDFPEDSADEYLNVRGSVLNYGIPGFVGALRDGVSAQHFCLSIHDALITHEPRLDPASVSVTSEGVAENRTQPLSSEFIFQISANIRGVEDSLSELVLKTVMHPFRVPEIVVVDPS